MLEKLYTYPFAAPRLRSSPLGPWLDSFVVQLSDLGYTPWSCGSDASAISSPDTTGSSGTEGIPAGFDPAPSTRESCRTSTTDGFLSRGCPGFVRASDGWGGVLI